MWVLSVLYDIPINIVYVQVDFGLNKSLQNYS